MSSKKFKVLVSAEQGLSLPAQTASRALQLDGSGNVTASAVTNTELGYVSGVTSAIQTQLGNNATAISDHISDATDAHAASAISNIPSGNLSATNQQSANDELQSDIDSRALDSAVIKKDGSVAFTADQSMGGFELTDLADPNSAQSAVTVSYLDARLSGLDPKASVRAATLVNGVLATDFEDGDVIDGVTLATGDRILIKDQTIAAENGIYIVAASGAPSRSTDADTAAEISGAYTFVEEGTQAGSGWVQSGTITVLGVDDVVFVYFNSAVSYTEGDGIDITANVISINLDGATLSTSPSGIKLSDTAVTPGSFGSATAVSTFTVDQQGRLTAAGATTIAIPASQITNFNEAAQDAVGGILTDTASIDFTYDDAGNQITADVLPGGVDHNSLANYVANEHVDHSGVSITGASNGGLSGGGDITASRTLSVDITNATAETSADNADLILIYDNSATALRKMSRSNFLAGTGGASAGDITETSFNLANNVSSAANVTGFIFANATVRSFSALVSVEVDATADLFEVFRIDGIQKGAGWDMSVESTGDSSLVVFAITSAGQIQYTDANYTGFVSGKIKFRAITTSF